MIDFDEVLGVEDSIDDFSYLIYGGLFFIGIFIFLIVMIDQQVLQVNQTRFQRGLSNSVKAYATSYSTSPSDLKSLSEGYLFEEDFKFYSVDTNQVHIDRAIGTEYFFNILEKSTGVRKTLLQTSGIYIVDIITSYIDGPIILPSYLVSIYKNGNEAQVIDSKCNSLEEVQTMVEDYLSVKLDLAVNYNASLRQAQKYEQDMGKNYNTNKDIYSTYSTTMAIVTNVPIYNMFGSKLEDVKEIQTYSIARRDGW